VGDNLAPEFSPPAPLLAKLIADIKGMNNAFWMTTEDHAETGIISKLTFLNSNIEVMTTSACSSTQPRGPNFETHWHGK